MYRSYILILSLLSIVGLNSGCQDTSDLGSQDSSNWESMKPGTYSAFVSEDSSFEKSKPPLLSQTSESWEAKGWKGERIHTQALIWTTKDLTNAALKVSSLVDADKNSITLDNVNAFFVQYVLTDHLGDLKSGCGIPEGLDTSLRADMIDSQLSIPFNVEEKNSQPIWLSINIPSDAKAGTYMGKLTISGDNYEQTLPFTVEVLNHNLPKPKDWTFHLDLWQNPYSVARIYDVEPWSEEHFAAMKPYMEMLANAGQKVITTTLIYDPWNGQTYDIYGSMVKWTKKRNGTWEYDFSTFDKWVNFMMDLGIDKYINTYSMIPWNLKFYYFDEAANEEKVLIADPGSKEYKEHWQPMLTEFAAHLKNKGWFDKTTIAMDERPEEHMQAVIKIIKAADPNFKISMAGLYHEDLQNDLIDYSIASHQTISEETLQERKDRGFNTTFYTCCAEAYPNTFTSSPYAESAWLGWHAINKGYDGYLRWAYNCWNEEPTVDSRFRSWSAGDTYLVYPGVRSSVRFERLREGIQDFEKVIQLRKIYLENGEKEKLVKLEEAIKEFELTKIEDTQAEKNLKAAKAILNSL